SLGVPMVHAGVVVTRDYLKAHPDVVKRFLQGYLDGWRFVTDPANEASVEQTLVKWTKTDAAIAKASYAYVFPAWSKNRVPTVNVEGLKTILAAMNDPRAKGVKPEQFIDNSILESLAK
ncbi:MAG: hypothetical protein KGJ86_23210, partial [Chloroflexota bacterium]|nr:hypothetical protein [Chloroflexota bacterium]